MITVSAPRENMRYGDVVEWLKANGFSAWQVRQMIESGVIEAHYVPKVGKHAYYSATQIKETLNGNRQEEPTRK